MSFYLREIFGRPGVVDFAKAIQEIPRNSPRMHRTAARFHATRSPITTELRIIGRNFAAISAMRG
jgi:hypothetical protein